MQQPGRSARRDRILIASLIAVVAAGWTAALLFWPRHQPAPAKPAPVIIQPDFLQASRQPARSQPATRPAASLPSGPALSRLDPPAPAPQSQPQPASQPVSRDTALLQALQRAEQLKRESKPREALAELQRALQSGPSTAPSSQSSQDPQDASAGLLEQLGKLNQSGQAPDSDALLSAALQVLGNSTKELEDLLDELEPGPRSRSRSSKTSRPGEQRAQPPAPALADVVASVYGQPITRKQIGAASAGPSEQALARLNDQILKPLFDIYARTYGIKATPVEVTEAMRVRPGNRPAAEALVIHWKVQQSLYEQYAGPVISGPGGSLEPVGAYRDFLQDQEKKGAFRIDDPKYRESFWTWYDQDFTSRTVPPEKVDFEKPWWLKPAAPPKTREQ